MNRNWKRVLLLGTLALTGGSCGGEAVDDSKISTSTYPLTQYTLSLKVMARNSPCWVTQCLYDNYGYPNMTEYNCPTGWPRNSHYVWTITEHPLIYGYWTIKNGYTNKCLTYNSSWQLYFEETCDGGNDQNFSIPGLMANPIEMPTGIQPYLASSQYVAPVPDLDCVWLYNVSSLQNWFLY